MTTVIVLVISNLVVMALWFVLGRRSMRQEVHRVEHNRIMAWDEFTDLREQSQVPIEPFHAVAIWHPYHWKGYPPMPEEFLGLLPTDLRMIMHRHDLLEGRKIR